MLDALHRDVRQAWRRLRARPTYAIVAVTTLSLVLGAGSAILAVVNATLVRPLPFPQSERLVRIYTMPPGVTDVALRNPLHPLEYVRLREQLRLADAVETLSGRERAIGGDGDPESVTAAQVSAGALPLLGGAPLIGRTFSEDEDRAGARLVVLGWGLWQRRFGGQATVIGRTIQLDREPFEIIGVMPRGFEPAYVPSELWTPLGVHAGNMPQPAATYLQTVARLRPMATVQQLDAEVRTAMDELVRQNPAPLRGWSAGVLSLREFQFGTRTPALLILLGAALVLSLIACANLANVTLAEVTGRRTEFALRAALGAGRADAVRSQVVEALLLAAAGGGLGLGLASLSLPLLLSLDPQIATVLAGADLDWRVQLGTVLLAVAVSLASALWPLLRAWRGDIASQVADGNPRTAGSRRDLRATRWLVGAEVALTLVLMVCGVLLLNVFNRVSTVDPGFDAEGLTGGQIRLAPAQTMSVAARAAQVDRIVERVAAIPGVTGAAVTLNRFIPGFAIITMVEIEGRPSPDGQPHSVQLRRVSPGYFRTMRIGEQRGRTFSSQDGTDAPPVAVVSQSFADRFWPGDDPIGRGVRRANTTLTVIGVVDDVRDVSLGQAAAPTFYVAYAQNNNQTAPIGLVVRSSLSVPALAPAIRAAVFSVDPAQPVDQIIPVAQFLADSAGPERFRSVLLLMLSGLALLLAVVGIYGVTARAAAERQREMGVRLALGASPSQVWQAMVGQSMLPVGAGLAVGAAGATAAALSLAAWLPGTEGGGVLGAAAAVILALAAVIAAAIPAQRVAGLDPTTALRRD